MPSARATEVAELLWELKRAGKLGKYTTVARKAGFAPGAGGRTIVSTIAAVRKDWPHLQWWRVVPDDGTFEKGSELHKALAAANFEITESDTKAAVANFEEHVFVWPEPEPTPEEVAAAAAAAAAPTPTKK